MGFQTDVYINQAPAVDGDFASNNPRASALTPAGGAFVAGSQGVTQAKFVWADPANPNALNNFGFGLPVGYVHRDMTQLITTYLAQTGGLVQPGQEVSPFKSGDFWVKNTGSNGVSKGMKAYANYLTGAVTFAATGTPPSSGSATGSIAANASTSATGTIVNDVFTAVSGLSGTFVAGAVLSGTGVVTGTRITGQISGTTGGLGTYRVDTPQNVASTSISAAYGVFTAASSLSGSFAVGDVLSGTGVTAGTYITQLGTGTGGLGTYYVSQATVVTSTTISATAAIETKWYAETPGEAGELIKMTSEPQG